MVVYILPSIAKVLLRLFCNLNCNHLCPQPHIMLSCCSNVNIAEVCMDWILDILDPDSGCVQQDPDSGFLNKNQIGSGFGFCNLLMKNGL